MSTTNDKRIPALVVSGFLGSGKTTLVRRLLDAAQAEGVRVAFISNEFGELGVDEALLGGGKEAYVELMGGCVCCALNDELYDTLIMLREQVNPDRIVIETSGVAIPHDVQITFYQPPIRDWVSEEACVTVVDAEYLAAGEDLEGTFTEQVETADLVILHKVDLVDAAAIPGLTAQIQALNPGVPVVTAEQGHVDPRLLFAAPVEREAPAGHDCHAACAHDHHHEVFSSREEAFDGTEDLEAITARLAALAPLRAKGFVHIGGVVHTVQGVGRRLEITPSEVAVDPGLVGRVVVIFRD